jgi:uroporphyrinogen-III synthase
MPLSPSDPSVRPPRLGCFESRRGEELRSLVERGGGVATVAPSLREVPLERNPAAFEFADELLAGRIDVVILLTGVGTRALDEILASRGLSERFRQALAGVVTVVRGPKPAAVLREWSVRIDHRVPEPNTWRELLATLDAQCPVAGRRVAVQEYGQPNPELEAGLRDRGADVRTVPVYRWELPEDLEPLRAAIRTTVADGFDALLFTSAQQIRHVLQVAREMELEDAFRAAVARNTTIASIGPTCSEALAECGLSVDVEASPPKMGHLVRATLEHLATRPLR